MQAKKNIFLYAMLVAQKYAGKKKSYLRRQHQRQVGLPQTLHRPENSPYVSIRQHTSAYVSRCASSKHYTALKTLKKSARTYVPIAARRWIHASKTLLRILYASLVAQEKRLTCESIYASLVACRWIRKFFFFKLLPRPL
jgi:hypothetical protein